MVSNTVITMVLMSKIATVILNATEGYILADFAIFLSTFIGVAGLVLNIFVTKIVKKYDRQSYIIFLMGLVIFAALILIII